MIYNQFLRHLFSFGALCAIDAFMKLERLRFLAFSIPLDCQTLVSSHVLGYVLVDPVDLCYYVIVTRGRLCNQL